MWGFQKSEIKILLILCLLLLSGSGLRLYQNKWRSLPLLQEIHDPGKMDFIETGDMHCIQKVSLNKANREELESLPGIGPVIAQRIIEYRNTHHRFKSIDEVRQVKGIGEKTLHKIRSKLTLD